MACECPLCVFPVARPVLRKSILLRPFLIVMGSFFCQSWGHHHKEKSCNHSTLEWMGGSSTNQSSLLSSNTGQMGEENFICGEGKGAGGRGCIGLQILVRQVAGGHNWVLRGKRPGPLSLAEGLDSFPISPQRKRKVSWGLLVPTHPLGR